MSAERRDPQPILLVEDDPHVQFAIVGALGGRYQADVASRVGEAKQKLSARKYDCILLDIQLAQGDDGLELVHFIRSDGGHPNRDSPVLVISGALSAKAVDELGERISGVLPKPFAMQKLCERIERLCGGGR